jgi:hypothetical protein
MRIRILMMAFIFMAGCTLPEFTKDSIGKPPVILQSFASPLIRPGDQLRIYIQAASQGADMKRIYTTLEMPGRGEFPVILTRVPKGQEKELSGYLYMNTFTAVDLLNTAMKITVSMQDQDGQFSKPASFSVAVKPNARMESPAAGAFKDLEIGSIAVNWNNNPPGAPAR